MAVAMIGEPAVACGRAPANRSVTAERRKSRCPPVKDVFRRFVQRQAVVVIGVADHLVRACTGLVGCELDFELAQVVAGVRTVVVVRDDPNFPHTLAKMADSRPVLVQRVRVTEIDRRVRDRESVI